jgi:hypothetical protein
VIQPKIIGDRVGLHPVTIIMALLVGTTLMGGIAGGAAGDPGDGGASGVDVPLCVACRGRAADWRMALPGSER